MPDGSESYSLNVQKNPNGSELVHINGNGISFSYMRQLSIFPYSLAGASSSSERPAYLKGKGYDDLSPSPNQVDQRFASELELMCQRVVDQIANKIRRLEQ